ncbi:MAG TPA: hypothetical protein VF553_20945 [Pyrinomonadaceae bacterium]|jgi:hypothetical protein
MNKERDISILDELRRIGSGYEFSFAATYNAYFPFYEEVVLRRLASAGSRANTLMMDGRQCAAAFAVEGSRPRQAGREYTLIPVHAGGAFHPKLLLLVGKRKGLMFVGSHNLTIAGFGHNRELTCRYEVDDASDPTKLVAFGQAWNFLRAWALEQPEELRIPFDDAETYAHWLRDALVHTRSADIPSGFFGSQPDGQALWEMVRSRVPTAVKRITVVAPFFDSRLDFLKHLSDELSPAEFIVGIEPERVEINHKAHSIMPNAKFVDAGKLREGDGYLHAKAILFEAQDGRELLITGSANASRQAWLLKNDGRNAEAVIITEGTSRKSTANALGLRALAKEAALSEETWRQIKRQPASRPKQDTTTIHIPLIAVETNQGFELEARLAGGELSSSAELVDASGNALATFPVSLDEFGFYQVEVPDIEPRRRASTIALQSVDGRSRFAIVHHTFDVAVSAQTERQRELQFALANLDAATPMLENMLKIVERAIFDDFDNSQLRSGGAGRTSAAEKDSGKQALSEDAPQTSFSASLADAGRLKRKRNFMLADDLTLIIDALRRRLSGGGMEASFGTGPAIARSEEELVDLDVEDEEAPDAVREIDGEALARTCQRKMRNMLRRMTAQLELAVIAQERTFGAIRQTAAVLALLPWLRELEQIEKQLLRGETFVRYEDEWQFFLDATRLLYSQRTALMKRALSLQAQHSNSLDDETSIVAGLLLWTAWDCALDVRSAKEAEELDELQENLYGMARLVALSSHICDDTDAQEKAREAINHISSYYPTDGFLQAWYAEHLAWLRKVSAICRTPGGLSPVKRMAEAGDLALPTLKASAQPLIVLGANGTSVRVVDLDKDDEQNLYGVKYISVYDPQSL